MRTLKERLVGFIHICIHIRTYIETFLFIQFAIYRVWCELKKAHLIYAYIKIYTHIRFFFSFSAIYVRYLTIETLFSLLICIFYVYVATTLYTHVHSICMDIAGMFLIQFSYTPKIIFILLHTPYQAPQWMIEGRKKNDQRSNVFDYIKSNKQNTMFVSFFSPSLYWLNVLIQKWFTNLAIRAHFGVGCVISLSGC